MHNEEFEFQYQNASLPPPFANQLYISVGKISEEAKIDFDQEYLYRDEINIEEIIQEGFPLEEKYQWKGNLPLIWFDASHQLFEKTTLIKDKKKTTEKEPKIWLKFQDDKGILTEGMPGDSGSWEYFLQELIQAVYEKGKMEEPLTIRLLSDNPTKRKLVTLIPSFVNRKMQILIDEKGKQFSKSVEWQLFRIIAKHVYALDYISEKSTKKDSEKNGLFIDPGDGLWYQTGISAKEPGKGLKNIDKIEELLKTL